MKLKNRPYIATEEIIMRDSIVYDLPFDLVEEIYSFKRVWKGGFFLPNYVKDNHTYNEYQAMLKALAYLFSHRELLGTKLPQNHPLSIEICKFLIQKGVSIQYHPKHGMVIVKNDEYDMH